MTNSRVRMFSFFFFFFLSSFLQWIMSFDSGKITEDCSSPYHFAYFYHCFEWNNFLLCRLSNWLFKSWTCFSSKLSNRWRSNNIYHYFIDFETKNSMSKENVKHTRNFVEIITIIIWKKKIEKKSSFLIKNKQ